MRTLFLLFFLPFKTLGQDITGIWSGFMYTNGNELPYELVISESGGKWQGYSLTSFTIKGVENRGLKSMKVKYKNGKVTIEDDKLVYNNYSTEAKRVMLFCVLSLQKEDTLMTLTGSFNSRSYNNPSYKGQIRLERKRHFGHSTLLAMLKEMDLTQSLSFLKSQANTKQGEMANNPDNKKLPGKTNPIAVTGNVVPAKPTPVAPNISARKIETIQTIHFKSDSLLLSLFDNGEIDGDTVSVLLNGTPIIVREALGITPINRTIYYRNAPGDSLTLVMYAENLGLIPPNTGLLVIQDGEQRHEVRFAGDYQKNSAILFIKNR